MKKSESKTLKVKPTKSPKRRHKKLSRIYSGFATIEKPYPPALFQMLADDYIEWAQQGDSLVLTEFPLLKGISPEYFWQLCRENEIISNANKIAKAFVACRREKLTLQGKLREKPSMHILHQYSDDWDKADKRWAELKKPEESKSETQVIVLDSLEPKETDEKE